MLVDQARTRQLSGVACIQACCRCQSACACSDAEARGSSAVPCPKFSAKPRWWWSYRCRSARCADSVRGYNCQLAQEGLSTHQAAPGSYVPPTSITMSSLSSTAGSRDRVTDAALYCGVCCRRKHPRASSQWNVPLCVPMLGIALLETLHRPLGLAAAPVCLSTLCDTCCRCTRMPRLTPNCKPPWSTLLAESCGKP